MNIITRIDNNSTSFHIYRDNVIVFTNDDMREIINIDDGLNISTDNCRSLLAQALLFINTHLYFDNNAYSDYFDFFDASLTQLFLISNEKFTVCQLQSEILKLKDKIKFKEYQGNFSDKIIKKNTAITAAFYATLLYHLARKK